MTFNKGTIVFDIFFLIKLFGLRPIRRSEDDGKAVKL